jgi:hypothetical protein
VRTRETTPSTSRLGAISTSAHKPMPSMRHESAEARRRTSLHLVGERFVEVHGRDSLAALGALVLESGA